MNVEGYLLSRKLVITSKWCKATWLQRITNRNSYIRLIDWHHRL